MGEKLALVGTINDQILNEEELAIMLIRRLKTLCPGTLEARYGVSETLEEPAFMEEVGRKRGCLQKGGEIDYARTAAIMLDEFRSGRLGRISLETPEDFT